MNTTTNLIWTLTQGFDSLPFTFFGEGAENQCTMLAERFTEMSGMFFQCVIQVAI